MATKLLLSNNSKELQSFNEQQLIGCASFMRDDDMLKIIDCLDTRYFYEGIHKKIWNLIKEVKREYGYVDLQLLVNRAMKGGVSANTKGFIVYLTNLAGRQSSTSTVTYVASCMIEMYFRTKLMGMAHSYVDKFADNSKDVLKLFAAMKKEMHLLQESCLADMRKINGNFNNSIDSIIESELQQIERDLDTGTVTGVTYGIPGMDKKIDLMVPGDFILIAGRPGMGKSVLALQVAVHAAAVLNIPVDFFSLEMTKNKLAHRYISMITQFTSNQILYRNLSKSDVNDIRATMRKNINSNLEIHDDPDLQVHQMHDIVEQRESQLMLVDYLQLTKGERNGNREQEISGVSRGLKRIGMKQRIPVIALSQLSRDVEKGKDRKDNDFRPRLSDLRESGSLEQDADTVIFVYRPKEYNIVLEGYPENITEIIVGKQRNGAKPTVPVLFDSKTNQFIKFTKENDNNESEIKNDPSDDPGF